MSAEPFSGKASIQTFHCLDSLRLPIPDLFNSLTMDLEITSSGKSQKMSDCCKSSIDVALF